MPILVLREVPVPLGHQLPLPIHALPASLHLLPLRARLLDLLPVRAPLVRHALQSTLVQPERNRRVGCPRNVSAQRKRPPIASGS
jgi:hypothetical protein